VEVPVPGQRFSASRFAVLAAIAAVGFTTVVSSQSPQADDRVDVLINFHGSPNASDRASVTASGGRISRTYAIVPAVAASMPRASLAGLANNPRIDFVEPDVQIFADDAELDNTWGVKKIGSGTAHDLVPAVIGEGIKVAVIDSGINYNHPDLAAHYGGGYDFGNNDADPMDDCGHGTHVAGTIGALNNDVGVVGVAPGVTLYALKFLGPVPGGGCSGATSAAISALDWAVQHGIQITNSSWGSSSPSATLEAAFANAFALGMLHVASAGNSGNCGGTGTNIGYPGGFRSVIAVGAVDSNDTRACFSSTGSKLEIAAPGVQINSTILNGSYGSNWNGTSMASPHVTGTAALLMGNGVYDANGNGRVNDEIRNSIAGSALDLGAGGRDALFGFGRVRVPEALAAAAAAQDLTLSVDQITYTVTGNGNAKSKKDLTVTLGTLYGLTAPVQANVTINLRLNGAFYASLSGTTDNNGLASWVVRGAPSGTYTTVVTVASSLGLTWNGQTPPNSVTK
jgi:subtilisin